jgi:translocation and assembly module TamB
MRKIRSLALIAALGLLPLPLAAQTEETAQQREDRGTITAFIEDNLSGAGRQVILRGFEGALSSRASAKQLTIADSQGVWLTLNDVVLDWSRSSLLLGEVNISELSAAEIIVARAPVADSTLPAPEAKGFALPELPVSIDIAQIKADRVVLGEPLLGQPIEGSIAASLKLSGGDGHAVLQINRTDGAASGKVDLDATYSNTTQQLDLSLDLVEGDNGVAATLLNLPGRPSVALSIKGKGPLSDLAATVDLQTAGQPRLAGQITLKGSADQGTRFDVDFTGDLAPLFAPAYGDFFGPKVALTASGQRAATGRLDLTKLGIQARSVQLQGSAQIAPDGLPEKFALQGKLADPDGKPVTLPGSDADISVQNAALEIGYDSTTGESWTGVITANGLHTTQANIDRLDLKGSGRIARAASGNTVGGTLTFASQGMALADAGLQQALGDAVSGSTRFWWQEGSKALNLAALTLTSDAANLKGGGKIEGLAEGLRLSGEITANATDLTRFSTLAGRALAGSGEVNIFGSGSPLGGDFDLRGSIKGEDLSFAQTQLDNLLRGTSQIVFDAKRDETGTEIRSFSIAARQLTADGKGVVTSSNADLDLGFVFSDLGALGPGYGGSLRGKASVSGDLVGGSASVVAALDGQDMRVGQAEADRLLQGASQVRLTATYAEQALQISDLSIDAVDLTAKAKGTLARSGSDVTARVNLSDLGALRAGYGGGIAADLGFKGTADNATLSVSASGQGLRVGQAQADRLLAGNTQLAASLALRDGLLKVDNFSLQNPALTASASASLTDSRRDLTLEARLNNLALLLPDFPGAVTVKGKAADDGAGYQLDLALQGPGQIDARIAGRLAANVQSGDLTIKGTAQAGLANPFLGARVVSGAVRADLRLNGPLTLAALSGDLRFSDGRFADPGLPFALQAITTTATLSGGRAQLDLSATASTGGTLTVRGPVSLTGGYDSDLAVQISGLVLKDPELFQTRANGALTVKGPLTGGAMIAGRIALPETELRIPSTGLGGANDLEGLRHLYEGAASRETRRRAGLLGTGAQTGAGPASRPFGLNVTISAPNRVFIRGRGLDAELGGEVTLLGSTTNVIPAGSFQLIRGRLDILGRRLVLSEAVLQLEGSLDPTIRVVASTETESATTSVVIAGNASDPTVTFTSSPELPQEEVLAQLLFGRDLTSLSAFQALQLANAVASLAGKGGEGIVGKLRAGFGLDDLDVKTAADGTAQLTAGKYLSKNLYSEVQVDQKGKSQITLNLDVTKNLTVKGRVGADGDTGIGLFFEKDY